MIKKIFQMTNKGHFINPNHIVEAHRNADGTFIITLTTGKMILLDKAESQYLSDFFGFKTYQWPSSEPY